MNKKRVYSLMLLLSLMFIIVCMGQLFKRDIREVAVLNNINRFKEYSLMNGKYKISLPEDWVVETRVMEEVNFLIKFTDNKSIEGNITIQNNIKDIRGVVNSVLENNINTKYNVYNEDGIEWYVIDCYKEIDSYKKKYYYKQLYEEKALLVEFQINKDNYKSSIETVFDEIAKSIR